MAKSMKRSNRDRISTLPEELRQHILSLLPCKEAIKTSIWSSIWRYDWLNLPTLLFDESIFATKIEFRRQAELMFESFLKIEAEKLRSFILLFLDFLERINIHTKNTEKCTRYTTTQVLDLYLCTLPEFYPRIVSFFKQLKVKELRLALNFGFLINDKDTEFLESIGDLQELTSLSLYIGLSGNLTSPLRLPSCLQNLSLDNVGIPNLVLEKLFDSNSCIESLCFNRCSGFTVLRVSGLPKLKILKVSYNNDLRRLEIDVLPSLCSLFFYLIIYQRAKLWVSKSVALKRLKLLNYDLQEQFGNSMNHLVVLEMEACINIHAFNVEECKKLSTLFLNACQITDDCLDKFIEKLPNIKHLVIIHCDLLEKIKISLSHLQLLVFLGCIKLHRVEINCPNLNHFTHVNFDNLIALSSITPFTPTSVYLWLPHRRNHSAEYVNLLELFKNIRNCENLTLSAYYIEDLMIIWRMRQSSCPPLYEVKYLNIKLIEKRTSQSLAKYAEALLWLFPQLIMMQFICSEPSSSISFKFKYKLPTPLDAKICGCYGSIFIRCWRHSVENFVMQEKIGFKDDYSLEHYLSTAIQ